MATQPSVVFGDPEFSQQVLAAFRKFFESCPRLTDSLNDLTGRAFADPEPYQRVVLNLGLLTAISMKELVTLAGNGLGQGAMKIARTVMESAINAEYIRRNPAECDLYLKWHWVEQHKLLAYVRQYAQPVYAHLTLQEIEQIETEFQDVRGQFETPTGNLRSNWCNMNLSNRAILTDFAEAYRLISPLSSQLIHGTFGGLSRHFDLSHDEHRISVPPSMEYVGEALIGGHMCLIKMVETVALTFGWTPINSISDLASDFHHVWDGPPPH